MIVICSPASRLDAYFQEGHCYARSVHSNAQFIICGKLSVQFSVFRLMLSSSVTCRSFCTDAAGTEGHESSNHTQETSLFSVEQPLFSAGYLPGALPPKVNWFLHFTHCYRLHYQERKFTSTLYVRLLDWLHCKYTRWNKRNSWGVYCHCIATVLCEMLMSES